MTIGTVVMMTRNESKGEVKILLDGIAAAATTNLV
jgi:hypothetical protein